MLPPLPDETTSASRKRSSFLGSSELFKLLKVSYPNLGDALIAVPPLSQSDLMTSPIVQNPAQLDQTYFTA